MTTVVAVQQEADVLLAWDGMVSWGNEWGDLKGASKVFARNGVVFGVAGPAQYIHLLRLLEFEAYDGRDAGRWIMQVLAPAIVEQVHPRPGMTDENGSAENSTLLVVDGTLFALDGHLNPLSSHQGRFAIGSGGDYALGALGAGADTLSAVTVAARLDPNTGGTLYCRLASSLILEEEDPPYMREARPAPLAAEVGGTPPKKKKNRKRQPAA